MNSSFHKKTYLLATAFIISVLIIANYLLEYKEKDIKKSTYDSKTELIHNYANNLIKNKRESTLSIALSLSRDKYMIEALKDKNSKKLDLDVLSTTLNKFTRFKNVWFQIIDKDGINFYRSWTKKRGDAIYKARIDIQKMLNDPKVTSSISVGKFDMTFKTMVPIYDTDGTYLGIFEIITHFNSISRKLREEGYEAIILADKKYKKQLTKAFTKMFIGDYYVANFDANIQLQKLVESKTAEYYINNYDDYMIDEENNKFITVVRIPDIYNQDMGYIILFKNLDSFYISDLEKTRKNIIFFTLIVLIFVGIFAYYLTNKNTTSILSKSLYNTKKEKEKVNAILEAQPYIIMLIDEGTSIEVNNIFFKFFDKYKTLEEFKKDHKCICDYFVVPENTDGTYLSSDDDWLEKVLSNRSKEFKVAMEKNGELYHFIIKANRANTKDIKHDFIILTFVDITDIKKKDEMLFEQSKNASMGEMIANIAHQWRQPLSVISTGVTGMMIQKEHDLLTDDSFYDTCNNINENAQYLSRTIDDFRNFIKGDSQIEHFNLKDNMEKFLHLVEPIVKTENINIMLDIDETIELDGYPNELLQCFINIFSNSKDVLKTLDIEEKLVIITAKKLDDKIEIIFKDNGGGIKEDIISKIFDPYFTTKHKSVGTGLGLHMTYKLITENMNGSILATNTSFVFEGNEHKGAQFAITLK